MKPVVGVLVAVLFISATGVINGQTSRRANQRPAAKATSYTCPMHPEVSSTKRGSCRKCGMALVKQEPVNNNATPPETESASSFSSLKIPDAQVYDQNGKQLKFYSDLIKGKTVAINFVFTTCTAICPPLTATFRRVQQEARARNLDVHLISISVDPTVDTPERLHDFAAKYKAGPNWTFVTGEKSQIDTVLQALETAVANKNDHTPMVLIGSDVTDQWTRAYGLSSPVKLVEIISATASPK